MIILGIETSCDETAAAVVKNGNTILSNIVASSADLHRASGGIVPENAARQQIKAIIPTISHSLEKAKKTPKEIDAIAVTSGPGLIGSLLVGVEAAKTLSFVWKKKIIPVNHLKAHLYANWLKTSSNNKIPTFPSVALVVSGGHTDLVLMEDHSKITWLGGTRDDAAGEAFDKTARLLGLPYPGGPSISKEADKIKKDPPNLKLFPRPMIKKDNFDFSFSGLKTSVLNQFTSNKKGNIPMFSAEVQEAIVDVLVFKSLKAINKYQPKSFLLAGGVAANNRLREKFIESFNINKISTELFIPPSGLCTDNATYIASCAFYNQKTISWDKIKANPELSFTGQG